MTRNLVKKVGVLLVLSLVVAVCAGAGAAADWTTYLGNDGRTSSTAEAGPLTNNTLWSVDNPYQKTTDVYWETPSVKDGKVYVSLYYGNSTWNPDVYNFPSVYCFDITTGKEVWNKTLFAEGGGRSGITIYGDTLYVAGYDGKSKGKVFCLSLDDGEILGQTEFICDQGYYGLTATPLVLDNTVWVNTFDYAYTKESLATSSLYGFSLDLKTQVDKELIPDFAGSVFASPSTDGADTIYIPGDGGVMKYSVSTGTLDSFVNVSANFRDYDGLKWRVSTPAYSNGVIYFYTCNVTEYPYTGSLYAYKEDGTKVFEKSIVSAVQSSSPAVSNSHIVVGNATGICVYSLDGTEEWFYQTGNSRAQNTPVIADDVAYFGTYTFNDCSVYAVDLTTKELVWSYKPATSSGMIEGSLAISDGVLYYGDMLKFYAIGEELPTPPVTTQYLFDGTVTLGTDEVDILLKDGVTKKVVAGNNGLAALDAAAKVNGFTYSVSEKPETGLGLDGINGIEQYQTEDGWFWWAFYVNDEYSNLLIGNVELKDGDKISLYFCNGNIEDATHIVNISVKVDESPEIPTTATVIYDGTVTLGSDDVDILLKDGVTKKVVSGNNGMAAVDAAAKAGEFIYKVSDSEYGLYIEGFNGINDAYAETGYSWAIYLNGQPASTGIEGITLNNGDALTFYYCKMDSNYNYLIDESTYVINILAKTTADFTLTLKEGWNFISVPQVLADNGDNANELFANIDTGYNSILVFDGEQQQWITIDGDHLIQPLYAYWLYSKESTTLDLTYSTQLSTPPSIKVYNGWNAVGVSTAGDSVDVKTFVAPLEKFRVIIPWNEAGITDKLSTTQLRAGTGNWLFIGEGDDLVGLTA